jgi:hypothetical protein
MSAYPQQGRHPVDVGETVWRTTELPTEWEDNMQRPTSSQQGTAIISNRLRLGLVAISIAVLFLFSIASPVPAIPPTTQTNPITPFTISGACSFNVLLEPLFNNEKVTTFFGQTGNVRFQIFHGGLTVRLTNQNNTSKSVDLNISGPIQVVPQPNGSLKEITLGPTLFVFQPGVAPSLPLLAYINGRTESVFDAAGNFHFLSLSGTVDDVCPLLS